MILLFAIASLGAGMAGAAEEVCDQSESVVRPAPGGARAASVQHQVCTSGGGVAAAITVFIGEAAAPLRGQRVLAVAVPRTREEWPLVRWRDGAHMEVWIPNLARVLESKPAAPGVEVELRYCGDDPAARAAVAGHAARMQEWMDSVRAWSERRKTDAQGAGSRPPRPEEPRTVSRPCTDADLAAHPAPAAR